MAATIHPTAVIDSSAEIGADVEIGSGNTFYPHACIGGRTQDLKYAGDPTYLEIGHDNVFRESVTVNRSDKADDLTKVGNHGNFLAYAHIAHDCKVGDHVIFSNNGTLAGHVTVEDHVILGGLTAVHQFCRLGAHAITGGCSKIIQDVPPYMIADGNPAAIRGVNKVGLERSGIPEDTRRAITAAHKTLFRSGLNTTQALARIREDGSFELPEIARLVTFIENSERGITRG